MKGTTYLMASALACFCTSLAIGQGNYQRLLDYTVERTQIGMTMGLTTVKLGEKAKPARVSNSFISYTTSLDLAVIFQDEAPGDEEEAPEEEAEVVADVTAARDCGYLTLPTRCDTKDNKCFSEANGPCTNNMICVSKGGFPCSLILDCDKNITLPPACGPLTSVTDCTKGADDCGKLTLYPKCETSTGCLTSSGANCDTKNWFCQKSTIAPACPEGIKTFNSEGTCEKTSNWDCVNTKNDICSTKATDCKATQSVPCQKTFSPRCLTYKGAICPKGPEYPTSTSEGGGIALALLLTGAVLAQRSSASKESN